MTKLKSTTMRFGALLLAGCLASAPASAVVVYDPSNHQQAILQVRHMLEQLRELRRQYEQMRATYEAIARLPDEALNRLGDEFDVDSLRDALPDPRELEDLLSGRALSADGRASREANRLYEAPETTFEGRELNRRGRAVANGEALARALLDSAGARIAALRRLEGALRTAPDLKAVADIQARLAMEQSQIEAQQVQAQALALWAQALDRSETQRREEHAREEIDRLLEEARSRAEGR